MRDKLGRNAFFLSERVLSVGLLVYICHGGAQVYGGVDSKDGVSRTIFSLTVLQPNSVLATRSSHLPKSTNSNLLYLHSYYRYLAKILKISLLKYMIIF